MSDGDAARSRRLRRCAHAVWSSDSKKRRKVTGAILRFRHEFSRELLTALEKMAGELQHGIRKDSRRRGATAPVTRVIAREVMVRTPFFARILSQFWLFDTVLRDRAPAPELRNTDDEAMLFCEVRFPLTAGEARVAVVLDGIEGFEREEDGEPRWRWFATGSPLWWDRLKSAAPALRRAVFDGRGRDEIGCQPLPSKVPP